MRRRLFCSTEKWASVPASVQLVSHPSFSLVLMFAVTFAASGLIYYKAHFKTVCLRSSKVKTWANRPRPRKRRHHGEGRTARSHINQICNNLLLQWFLRSSGVMLLFYLLDARKKLCMGSVCASSLLKMYYRKGNIFKDVSVETDLLGKDRWLKETRWQQRTLKMRGWDVNPRTTEVVSGIKDNWYMVS